MLFCHKLSRENLLKKYKIVKEFYRASFEISLKVLLDYSNSCGLSRDTDYQKNSPYRSNESHDTLLCMHWINWFRSVSGGASS
jgi:hypothetical protein